MSHPFLQNEGPVSDIQEVLPWTGEGPLGLLAYQNTLSKSRPPRSLSRI